jgi:Mrp family chromosome partitioning ATPase
MLEALRYAEPDPRRPRDEDQPVLCPVPSEALAADDDPGSEVPFIEVGPRHSLEGSPEVLACAPPAPLAVVSAPEPAAEEGVRPIRFRPVTDEHRPGVAAPSRLAPELTAFHTPDLPAAAQYRELLAALLPAAGASAGEVCPVLLFTASEPGVGATTVVLNLAISAARQPGRRVVVVDTNLGRPAVADRLGLPAAPGLREVLCGAASLDSAVRPTAQENLLALTAGLAAAGPGPRFVAETTRSLLRQLRRRADLVFLDGPCWDGRAEAASLATAADAVFLVLPEGQADSPRADALLQAIPLSGARLAGCVLSGNDEQ